MTFNIQIRSKSLSSCGSSLPLTISEREIDRTVTILDATLSEEFGAAM
jgi:hypothetical protein